MATLPPLPMPMFTLGKAPAAAMKNKNASVKKRAKEMYVESRRKEFVISKAAMAHVIGLALNSLLWRIVLVRRHAA